LLITNPKEKQFQSFKRKICNPEKEQEAKYHNFNALIFQMFNWNNPFRKQMLTKLWSGWLLIQPPQQPVNSKEVTKVIVPFPL